MGILDSLKNALTGGERQDITAPTKSPSEILRENGLDPAGLDFSFGSDGSVNAAGSIALETDRQKIIDLLQAIPGIKRVEDNMTVAIKAAEPEPTEDEVSPTPETTEAESVAVVEAETATEEGAETYTVQSGDTLWKIASTQYGDGSKYMKIFEANTGLLENPDRIFPGQELIIPNLAD